MKNAISFDVEDWFQVENLKPAIPRDQWDKLELRVEANTRKILSLLRESGSHATFFILGWIAERCPDLVREIDREGHEVASHGYGHELVYNLTPEAFREDLLKSRAVLEGIIKKRVIGYRAPSFSITPDNLWALDVLKETGFEYDSSVFPTSVHDRYGFAGANTRPFVWPNGLIEIPLSVYKVGRVSLPAAGGGYFRLAPYSYFRAIFSKLNRRREPITFYMHPWELDPGQPRVNVPWFYRFRHYVNLSKTESRLRKLLRDFRFVSLPEAHSFADIKTGKAPTARTRIAYVIDRLGTNQAGTENQLIKMINGLNPERFEVHLICFNDHPWLRENRHALNCQVHIVELNRFKHPVTYLNFFRLVRLCKRLRFDVVHTFFPVGNILGVLGARLAGIKHVVSSRRDYGEWMRGDYLAMTRFANRFVKRITTNSHRVKELTVRVEKFDAERIDVFYNGIDTAGFAKAARDGSLKQELGIPASHKVVGIVANFRPMKRHENLIRAAKIVLDQRGDVDFVLVGQEVGYDGAQARLENLAQELGIRERIRFVGARKDIARCLGMFDVGVNCSEGEGLSNAVMEYMAAGVPCVVSNSGGNPDLITHDVHGAIFVYGDNAAFASEILKLLNDPLRGERFAAAARQRIEGEMSLPAMLKNYQHYYENLIGASSDAAVAPAATPQIRS